MTDEEWLRSEGVPCPRCDEPVLRFRDGVCLPCAKKLLEQADRKEKVRQRFLKYRKAHNAKIGKKKKASLGRPS